MSRINKTKGNLMDIWNDLDEAYERIEKSLEKLSSMSGLSKEFTDEIDRFDISAISGLKQRVEMILDESGTNV